MLSIPVRRLTLATYEFIIPILVRVLLHVALFETEGRRMLFIQLVMKVVLVVGLVR
jgi:hypothetical protein